MVERIRHFLEKSLKKISFKNPPKEIFRTGLKAKALVVELN